VRNLFTAYRALALIVGVLLTVLVFVGLPLEYLTDKGTSAHQLGESLTMYVGVAHGWIYMGYLAVAFALSRRLKWPVSFTALVLLAGVVPILIFWVERKVTQRVRDEHPELVVSASSTSVG
jgi:integral membrane protein